MLLNDISFDCTGSERVGAAQVLSAAPPNARLAERLNVPSAKHDELRASS